MFEFLGVTLGEALSSLPPIKASYYEYVIQEGDAGYYSTIQKKENRVRAKSHLGEIEACTVISAHLNNLDPKYLRTIMRTESGWPGAAVGARNGSKDIGIVQINPKVWDKEFSAQGINLDWSTVRDDVCTNLYVGGVILARRFRETNNEFEALGNYHRYVTKNNSSYHITYRRRAVGHLLKIQHEYSNWLKSNSNSF